MRPTARELITYLDESFNDRILPELTDPLVRNRANVLNQIIGALYQRWSLEGQMLVDDNTDLEEVLGEIAPHFPAVDVAGALARAGSLRPEPGVFPTVERLTEVNNVLRGALVAVIEALAGGPAEGAPDVDEPVHAYLRRQLDRELALCAAPVFGEGEGIGRRPDLPRA